MADNNPNPGERLFKVNVGEACRQIVAGTFGGIACTVVGYPFDTLKVRMQMGASLSELLKTMSFRNLFAGIAAPIYSAMPIWAAGYSGYNLGKEIAAATSNTAAVSNSRVSPQEFFLGGFTSGVLVSLVRCPTDVVKVNCQNTGRSASSYLREVLTSKGGVWSLTRGMVPTVLHTIPSTTVFFGSYDIFYNMVFHEEEGLARPLLAGGCAGMVEWAVTFPIDTFKTRYQASSSKSLADCWRALVAEAGGTWLRAVAILYRGITPMLVRAFPANSVALAVVESSRSLMSSSPS